jgi:tetratricopeptide (TPR) repeat protein
MEERKILDSWKEISAYLSRSVMTCHRWEEELGLPIHRLDGTPKARVFAYTDELDRWLAEKLHVAEAPRQERHKKTKWIWITAGAVLVVAAVAAIGWRLFLQAPIPVPAQVPSLAVLPFENRTGDGTWDAWKKALPDLIMIDLRQSKFMDVINTSSLFQAGGALAEAEKFSPEDLKKVGEKAEVDFVLTGNFTKSGAEVIIASLVHNAKTGEVVASPRLACRTERDIFSSVDDLSKEVKIALNLRPREIRRDIDKPVTRITTTSPEAFKLYSQGNRIRGSRKPGDAIALLQKAVALDPRFGLAYRWLYNYCRAVSRMEDWNKYGDIAFRLADRLEERERATFLGGYYFRIPPRLDHKKVVQAYQRLGKNYPYDSQMGGLARLFIDQEEWEKAIPILEKLKLRHKKRPSLIQDLAACYRFQGLFEKAEKMHDEYLKENPMPAIPKPEMTMMSILEDRWKLALAQQKFDGAHRIIDQLISAFPNIPYHLSRKGFTYFMQDDFANAEKVYQIFSEKDNPRARMSGFLYLAEVSLSRGEIEEAKQRILRGLETAKSAKLKDEGPDLLAERNLHYFLAYLHRLGGHLPEALKEAELACRFSGEEGLFFLRALHLKALITVEMNRFQEFEKQIEEIKRYSDPDRFPFPYGYPRLMRVYYHLLGHRELQKKNYDLAISYFWKALDLLSALAAGSYDADHAKYFYSLAEALERSGQGPDAFPMYEKIILPTVSREFSGDQYARSYYGMGQYYERMITNFGTPEDVRERRLKAIGYYRKFLDLWKDADPIFPEVEDAKARLARLEAE